MLRDKVAAIDGTVKYLQQQVAELQTAHDELFDFVAKELGAKSVTQAWPTYTGSFEYPTSPRRLKTVTTTEVERTKKEK